MHGVCVLFGDDVEEIELFVPVDILRRCGAEVALVSTKKSKEVNCAHGIRVIADSLLTAETASTFDALILPGGPGSYVLKDDINVLSFVKNFRDQDKLIGAICAAPLILHNAGVLTGKKYCAHPCTYTTLVDADRTLSVVKEKNLITAKGPGAASDFAFAIVSDLCDEQKASAIKKELFFFD